MRLSDIMSHMNLATYPEIGLVIFLAVFAVISWRVMLRRHSRDLERFASMPLDDLPHSNHPPD